MSLGEIKVLGVDGFIINSFIVSGMLVSGLDQGV